MSEFIYHIHYRPGFKMGQPDGLSGYLKEVKSRMDAHFFHEAQLLAIENDNIGEEEAIEDMELEGIDVAKWEKNNGLHIVLQEYKLQVLHQHHDSQVAGYWKRNCTQELICQDK